MTQKGLAPILIVLILAFLVGGYLVYTNYKLPVFDRTNNRTKTTPSQTTQSSSSSNQTGNWKTYTHSDFIFKYPPELKEAKDCRGSGSGICFQSPEFDPTEGDFIAGTNKGQVLMISADSGNINNIADLHCEERNLYYANSCFYSTINNKSVLHLQGGIKENDKFIVTNELLYVQVDPNKIIQIGFFNSQEDAENQRKIFDQILSTFKFLD